MIDFLFFLMPAIWLGTTHHRRWGSILDPAHWASASGIALVMYVSYMLVILVAGSDALNSYYSSNHGVMSFRGKINAFMLPSTGLAIAMFPKAASEQMFNILAVARAGAISELATVIGWSLVAYWLFFTAYYISH
ncbi:MAG: hypothetical protein Q7T32_03940 [Moraxellaceae bacterium]|nr:hypothetical protein [Moraxellaceae bacterium]